MKHNPGSGETGKQAFEDARGNFADQTFQPYATVVFSMEYAHPVDVQRPYFGVWPVRHAPALSA
ncbi:hypothetical protein ACT6SE_01345 [Stenotrophomonas sp. LC732]|uniref:hypothetical protein n=1 Tax=Stenotrophomonas TaxID=40323 RepID=UPI00113093E0|nr:MULTISPECIES: hypothetical protein [unclassified Stenotrophomonas]MBH1516864.1 hypothetical protein [Stenotrophomonas maltophilia]MBF9138106.1 hypothetical protein [Stenotrophomonas sp. 232]MBH1577858.1 hypothetical protein [Stenotrophomonas maltophilia]MBH1776790.1 hypothetical protein [Stenotrophomonas maltophilia]MBN4975295.1 hypothetical protein [Stenotrophomonas maltophilia]